MIVRELITTLGFKTDESGANKYNSVLKSLATTAAAVFSVKKIIDFGSAMVTSAGDMEQVNIAFETMLNSQEKATQLMKEISVFASKTPFEQKELIGYSKQLLAFGFSAESIVPTMTDLGNIAAGVGKEKLGTIVYSLGKINTKGKAGMEELNMMLEAGVPILDTLAKQFGVEKDVMFQMISAGKVGFEDVNTALKTLSNTKFANLMDKQSRTFQGAVSNMQDTIYMLGVEIGSGMLTPLSEVVGLIIEFITANKGIIATGVGGFFKFVFTVLAYGFLITQKVFSIFGGFGKVLSVVVNTSKAFAKAFLWVIQTLVKFRVIFYPLLAYLAIYNGIMIVSKIVTLASTVATWALNAALLANPVSLIVMGVLLLIGVLIYLGIVIYKNLDKIKAFFRGILDGLLGLWEGFVSFLSMLGNLWRGFWVALGDWFSGFISQIFAPFNAMWENIQGKLDAVKSFFGIGKDMKLEAKTSMGAASTVANNTKTVNNNVMPTTNIQVPAGTTEQQADYLKKVTKEAVASQWDSYLRGAGTQFVPVTAGGF